MIYWLRFSPVLLTFLACHSTYPLARDSIQITANTWETKSGGGFGDFTPQLAFDGVTTSASSWRAELQSDVFPWLQFTFPEPISLRAVDIHFHNGDQRKYVIDILASADEEPQSWQTLVEFQSSNPSFGPSTIFQFPDTKVRHLRIVGHGNSSDSFPHWTNIVEVRFIESSNEEPVLKTHE